MQRLLVDTDIFCKLGIAGLLEPAVALFDTSPAACGCLPALPHMLRRGKLPKLFGADACARLVQVAESMSAQPLPSTASVERLAKIDRIDVGEAQLLAAAADLGVTILTGDKRALLAVAQVPDFPPMLAGRVATLEAVLISLCGRLGDDAVRAALQPLLEKDLTVRVCFSATNADPRTALRSYFDALKRDVAPLSLWKPMEGTK